MKYLLLTCLLISTTCTLFGQSNTIWTSFSNQDSTLIGFKDSEGRVKIEPKFMGLTSANKFEGIMAVTEEKGSKWESYYLTRSGRSVGRDSLYSFDNTSDCECEGFIRFTDQKTEQTGLFNSNGTIAVPAAYSTLSNVRNGLIYALQGAKKDRLSPDDEHWYWKGGKDLLIDINNTVLIEDFQDHGHLDFYSLKISDKPEESAIRQTFKGVNGKYYSFIDTEKEFAAWLKATLTSNPTKETISKTIHSEVLIWEEPEGWATISKQKFVDTNSELIRTKLNSLSKAGTDYHVFSDGLNPFLYDSPAYKEYYDNCGQARSWKYPVKTIVINRKGRKDMVQDHFVFLRTDKGYQMISMTMGI